MKIDEVAWEVKEERRPLRAVRYRLDLACVLVAVCKKETVLDQCVMHRTAKEKHAHSPDAKKSITTRVSSICKIKDTDPGKRYAREICGLRQVKSPHVVSVYMPCNCCGARTINAQHFDLFSSIIQDITDFAALSTPFAVYYKCTVNCNIASFWVEMYYKRR